MLRSGPILMILAQIAFTAMVVFVKIARQELSTFEVALWRSLIAVPVLLIFYRKTDWRIGEHGALIARTVFGFGALCCFYAAAKELSIADLSLISKIQPLLVAVLAPLLLGMSERASSGIWWLMLLALFGCSILLAPSLQVGSVYGMLAVAAACFSAVAHVFLRKLRTQDSAAVVMWFQAGSGVLAVIATLLTLGRIPMPEASLWLPLVGVGVTAAVGQLLMTAAYREDKAAIVATASYAGPLAAVVADALAFAVLPTWNVYLGGGVVILCGFLLLRIAKE